MFKATLRGENEVAVKTLRVGKITKSVLAMFKAELVIMAPLHHPNLVRLFGGVWNEGVDKLCIVLELCHHGSLKAFFRPKTDEYGCHSDAASLAAIGTWEGPRRYGLALGVAKCLRYLHHELAEPLLHRDIKPENILVGKGIVAKVADFGSSKKFDTKLAKGDPDPDGHIDALVLTQVGTDLYCMCAGRRESGGSVRGLLTRAARCLLSQALPRFFWASGTTSARTRIPSRWSFFASRSGTSTTFVRPFREATLGT